MHFYLCLSWCQTFPYPRMDKSCYCIYKLTPASSLTPTSVGMQNLGRKHRRMLQIRHAHLGNHIYHLLAKHWNKHADQTDNYLLRSNDYPCTADSGQHDGGILVQIWAYFNISLYEYCKPPQKQSKPELSHYQKPGVSLYWYVMRSFNFSDKFRSYYLQFT